jgi:O-antigen ligase
VDVQRAQLKHGSSSSPVPRALPGAGLERLAVAVVIALAVARPAFPSEDAAAGSGLLVAIFWGVPGVLWVAAAWQRREMGWYPSALDIPVTLLLALVITSTCNHPTRPAITMATEWMALGLSFFAVRQLVRSATARRALVTAMLATAFAVAVYGLYQAFWGLESLRREIARDRPAALRAVGIRPGSPEEVQFDNRLNSHEPYATFALANSLGGFLVAWLPVALSMWLERRGSAPFSAERPTRVWQRAALAAVASTILICLLMTQSRSAYVGLAVALAILAIAQGAPMLWQQRRWWPWLAVAFAVLLGLARWRGKVDEKLITEAGKSLGYRLEYWTATLALIAEHPWLGVGPGNFRGHYLKHKLPQSSEEIADPHNFWFEVAAGSGVPAAIGLTACIVLGAWRMVRRRPTSLAAATASTAPAGTDGLPMARPIVSLLAGGPVGLWLAWWLSDADVGLLLTLVMSWVLAAWSLHRMPLESAAVGFVSGIIALCVNLLAAGGIAMPGVGQSLWLLLAVGLTARDAGCVPVTLRSRFVRGLASAAPLVALFGASVWLVQPVLECKTYLVRASESAARGDPDFAARFLLLAAEADPWSSEPWAELARIEFGRWAASPPGAPRAAAFDRALRAIEQMRRRSATPGEAYGLEGQLWAARAETDPPSWHRAAEAFGRTVEWHPAKAGPHADLADALWRAGQHEQAEAESRRALDLDERMPHADKKLPAATRARLRSRLPEPPAAAAPAT